MKKILVIFFSLYLMNGTGLCFEKSTSPETEFPQIKPCGFARVLYTVDSQKGKKNGFTISQARLGLKGNICQTVSYAFSIEGTNAEPNNNKALYDVYVDVKSIPRFSLRLGQFKYKLSLENVIADPDLELINKSYVVSNLVSPTRDIGVELSNNFNLSFLKFDWAIAVVNGNGSNTSDDNEAKTVVARFVFSPLRNLNLGGSFYDGAVSAKKTNKDRKCLELKYEFDRLLFKAEYILGTDGSTKEEGYYVTAGYTVMPATVIIVRCEVWDPNLKIVGTRDTRWTFGLNYFLDKNVLIRNNYERKLESPRIKNDLLMTQLQIRF